MTHLYGDWINKVGRRVNTIGRISLGVDRHGNAKRVEQGEVGRVVSVDKCNCGCSRVAGITVYFPKVGWSSWLSPSEIMLANSCMFIGGNE